MKKPFFIDWIEAHIIAGEIIDHLQVKEASIGGRDTVELVADVLYQKRGRVWNDKEQHWQLPDKKEPSRIAIRTTNSRTEIDDESLIGIEFETYDGMLVRVNFSDAGKDAVRVSTVTEILHVKPVAANTVYIIPYKLS